MRSSRRSWRTSSLSTKPPYPRGRYMKPSSVSTAASARSSRGSPAARAMRRGAGERRVRNPF
eukprot:scaffold241698_cov40-Tisochrysis_lutea.AAC.2